MSESDLDITLGVEEEFFLVDPETRDLVSDLDPGIFEACERKRGLHKIAPEGRIWRDCWKDYGKPSRDGRGSTDAEACSPSEVRDFR